MCYVCFVKLLVFASAYRLINQLVPYICNHPTKDMFSISKQAKITAKYSSSRYQLHEI
jgi:hypothetical protein